MNASVWIKIKAKKSYNHWSCGPVSSSKSKPTTGKDEVAIKLNIEIPNGFFEKPQIEAKITIPKGDVNKPVISAEVEDNVAQLLTEQLGVNVHISAENPLDA